MMTSQEGIASSVCTLHSKFKMKLLQGFLYIYIYIYIYIYTKLSWYISRQADSMTGNMLVWLYFASNRHHHLRVTFAHCINSWQRVCCSHLNIEGYQTDYIKQYTSLSSHNLLGHSTAQSEKSVEASILLYNNSSIIYMQKKFHISFHIFLIIMFHIFYTKI